MKFPLKMFFFILGTCYRAESEAPKIGIVGGGIGGCATAYFIEDLFGKNNVSIDLFESNKIGGRLATEKIKESHYEVGGSVIHPKNKYMVDFVELFGLQQRNSEENGGFGLYNGNNFVFTESSESLPIWNVIKLLWRYGYDTVELKYFINNMLEEFSSIYTMQSERKSFETMEQMLHAMHGKFVEYLKVSAKDGFEADGFSEKLIDELILAVLLVNYGQTTNVHQFVGAVSIAGGTPGVWAVEGGNHIVAEKLLVATNATLIGGQVVDVSLMLDKKMRVSYIDHGRNFKSKMYDIVILALPIAENIIPKIKFSNFPGSFNFPGRYHQTVCTILKGDLNKKFFGLDEDKIQDILSINSSLFFNSIGKIYPVHSKKNGQNCSVWKIFSQLPLHKEELQKLFSNVDDVKSIPWLAYPHYDTSNIPRSFVLYNHLYYLNAIEWAASAMEMSIIGAKNVALLAHTRWFNLSTSPVAYNAVKQEL